MKKFIFSKFAGLYLATLPTNQLLDKYFQHHFILSHSPLCIDSIPPSPFEDPPPPPPPPPPPLCTPPPPPPPPSRSQLLWETLSVMLIFPYVIYVFILFHSPLIYMCESIMFEGSSKQNLHCICLKWLNWKNIKCTLTLFFSVCVILENHCLYQWEAPILNRKMGEIAL